MKSHDNIKNKSIKGGHNENSYKFTFILTLLNLIVDPVFNISSNFNDQRSNMYVVDQH